MSTRTKSVFFVPLMMMVILLVSACSQTTTGGTTTSSLTPLQVLQNSTNAMQKLKSSHIEIQLANNTQTTGASAPSTVGGTPAASGTPVPQNVTIMIKGSGDQVLPNQQLDLAITALNQTTKVSELTQGSKLYVRNAQGQWYVMDRSALQNYVSNPFAGVNISQNDLLGLVTEARITDYGTQSLNGMNLRHISADLDKNALKQLLSNNPDLKSTLGQQNINTLLNHTKSFKSSIDVWIDETQFYIHRTEFKLNMQADTTGLGNNVPRTISTNLDTIVDLSKFNAPVTLTIPSSAIPTSNPGAIIGLGKP